VAELNGEIGHGRRLSLFRSVSFLMSAPSATTAPQQINVADLELPQLGEVKRQLEEACCSKSVYLLRYIETDLQELSHLTNSFAQLKQAQAKFRSCIESAKEVKPENKGKHRLNP
jgi:prefoldin alpha subunit